MPIVPMFIDERTIQDLISIDYEEQIVTVNRTVTARCLRAEIEHTEADDALEIYDYINVATESNIVEEVEGGFRLKSGWKLEKADGVKVVPYVERYDYFEE